MATKNELWIIAGSLALGGNPQSASLVRDAAEELERLRADHSPDDDLPPTVERLVALGGSQENWCIRFVGEAVEVTVSPSGWEVYTGEYARIPTPPTMRRVRELLRGLGVEVETKSKQETKA